MDVREARRDDAEGIRRVTEESFAASYGGVLEGDAIDPIVAAEFGEDRLEELLDDPDTTVLVAVRQESVVGVAVGTLVEGDPLVGLVRWIHVHPDDRGDEVGVRLLGEIVRLFETNEADLVRGHVLEGNEAGGEFYRSYGFEESGTATATIADDEYDETIHEHHLTEGVGEEVLETVAGPDGEDLVVDYSAADSGNEAPFYPVFTDDSLADRYGWRCGNCDSLETVMDSSGRVKCERCGNTRKATRWDDSYL